MSVSRGTYWGIVGIDGAGKTSVLQALRRKANVSSTHWSNLITALKGAPVGPRLTVESPDKLDALSARSRFWYLGSLALAEYEYLIQPHLASGELVLADSLLLKILTRENFSAEMQSQILASVPLPTRVIMIDTPPQVALRRKRGLVGHYEAPDGPATFVTFQEGVRQRLLSLTRYTDLRVIPGDEGTVDQIAVRILQEIGV